MHLISRKLGQFLSRGAHDEGIALDAEELTSTRRTQARLEHGRVKVGIQELIVNIATTHDRSNMTTSRVQAVDDEAIQPATSLTKHIVQYHVSRREKDQHRPNAPLSWVCSFSSN